MTKEMNLIFDLQLFDDPVKEVLLGTGAAETVTIGVDTTTIKAYKYDGTNWASIPFSKGGNTVSGFNAGGGADSITVAADLGNITIAGGSGNDYVTINNDSPRTVGNVYSIASGQGNDSILGWDEGNDTLQIGSAIQSSFMSTDGNDLTIKFASGSVKLVGVGAKNSTAVNINIMDSEGTTSQTVVPYIMQGTTKTDTIINTDQKPTVSDASTLRSGAAGGTNNLTIDGGAGNDFIINEGSNVYIDGGAGKDQITVQAQGLAADPSHTNTTETSSVTINAGAGNDSITFLGKDTVSGHFLIYNQNTDGKDVIVGFSSDDTISLTGTNTFNQSMLSVDNNGDVIIKFDNANQITLKEAVTLMGGQKFHINGDEVPIPKEWVGTSSANTKLVDSSYKGYTINALGGNDSLTITAATVYADGGAGNDIFTLSGGTNIESSSAKRDAAVTIYGGLGNDSINAEDDKNGDTKATHVYSFKPGEGTDSIKGFNENDTIQIEDANATVSGEFVNGQYKLTITDGTNSGYVVLEDYAGGSNLNLRIKTDEGYASLPSSNFSGDGASPVAGKEYYQIAKQAQLSEKGGAVTINSADQKDFVVTGNKGDDKIVVKGVDGVSIYGGAGKDSIYILPNDDSKYGSGITINGGAGNDSIVVETVISGSTATNPTGADLNAKPKVYVFGYNDGNDSIVGFNEFDQIQIDSDSTLLDVSVAANGKDAVVAVGKANTNTTKTTATITLVDFASHPLKFNAPIKYATWDTVAGAAATLSAEKEFDIPKIYKGTTGADSIDTSNATLAADEGVKLAEGFMVSLGAGNDSINNGSVNEVTLDAGAGNDTIINGGKNVYIDAGAGNDIITLTSTAEDAVIIAGAGNDSIYGNANGGHTYRFDGGQGTNYIVNFNPDNDIIQTSSGTISSAEVTSNGVKLTVTQSGTSATTIYLKGSVIKSSDTGKTDLSKYQLLEGSAVITTATLGGSTSSTTLDRIINGTTGKDVIENTIHGSHLDVDGYTINADSGNDVIYNSGSNVTINAGAGNDTVYLMQDAAPNAGVMAQNVTVGAGAGNDLIISNGESHRYVYSGGKDSIYGFGEDDILDIGTSSYTTSLTSDGFLILVNGSKTNTILLKGARSTGNANSTTATDYAALEAGTKINIANGTGNTVYSQEITPKYLGTDDGTDINIDITSKEIADTYIVDARSGNDKITVAGDNISVNAGLGDDIVTIKSGNNITVQGAKGNDTIYVEDTDEVGHVFEFAKGDSNNIIYGLNAKDTIKLITSGDSIYSYEFQNDTSIDDIKANDNGFVLTLSDKKTKITLLGAEDSDNRGKYKSLKDGSFFIEINGEAKEFNVPTVLKFDANNNTIDTLKSDASNYIVLGDKRDNTLTNNGADNVLISLGAGNDSITIVGGEGNTINPGTGKDYVTLQSHGHIYQYANNDGDDTIVGWTSDDSLVITGATSISSMMSSLNSGNGIGKDFQLKVGSYKITFVNTEADTQINLISEKGIDYNLGGSTITAGAPKTFSIPSLVAGTSGADVLSNDREAYTITAGNGNDTISNTGASVTINAGAGNDTVNVTTGENVVINAEDGNDTVEIDSSANNAYVDGGAGKDVIIVKDDVTGVSVKGGAGDDLIIGNNSANVYFYNKGDGNDSIYGYTSDDRIVLGDSLTVYTSSSNDSVKTEVTDNGLVFSIYQTVSSGSYTEVGKLTLKGQRSGTEGSTTASDYEQVEGGTQFVFEINGSEVTYEIPLTKVVSADAHNVLDNTASNYLITGTANADTITNTGDNVTIDALAGNDTIKTGGSSVSINAGVGNDTVVLTDRADNATVDPGTGNDLIINNGSGGHVYRYSGGKDSIYGFNEDDSLIIDVDGGSYTSSITADGVLIKVKNSSSSTILLKGDLKDGETPGTVAASSYNLIKGGTTLNIQTLSADGSAYTATEARVESSLVGTSGGDIIDNDNENYSIVAYGGADTITNDADSVYIDAGAGADQITVNGGRDVTVVAGTDNDLITIKADSDEGHLFQFSTGDGSNTIKGFGANDSIRIASKGASIKTADFEVIDSNEYFVLTLTDNRTKIYMLEQDITNNNGQGKSGLRKESFTVQYRNPDDTGTAVTYQDPQEFKIPNLFTITDAEGKNTIDASNPEHDKAVIFNSSVGGANSITVGAAEVSVFAGKGNDIITVTSGAQNATINAGLGDDKITLNGAGHVIEYANGDGKDTIWGWNDENILNITSDITPEVSVSSAGEYILKIGSGYINFGVVDAETDIKVYKNGSAITEKSFAVPKSLVGGTGPDNLISPGDDYTISAGKGDDTVINGDASHSYNNVIIDAGAGNDTVDSYGDNVSIKGDAGNDSINIGAGSNVSVDGGAGIDFITLQAGVVSAVIDGGAGNDHIYSNGEGNIFKYTSGGGNDSIFGYTTSDSIQIGKDVSVTSTEMTADGFIIHLNDNGSNRTLTLKGARKDGATDEKATSYKDLEGGTGINVSTVKADGSLQALDIVSPFIKFVHSTDHTLSNPNTAENYTLTGSAVADTIVNTAANVTIDAGAKNDVIINEADAVYINGGAANDIIYLGNTTVNGNEDPVTIDNLTIYGVDANAYSFEGYASNNTIYGGAGNDIIYGNGNGHVYEFYSSTDGKDTIYNFTNRDVIHLGTVEDYYGKNTNETWTTDGITDLVSATYQNLDNAYYKDVILKVGFGTITLKSLEVGSDITYSYLYTTDNGNTYNTGYHTFQVQREYVMDANHKTANNTLDENFIISRSTTQQDTIVNSAANVTISAGGGGDTIQNSGITTSIMAGIGNDTVFNKGEGTGVTIDGGEGYDSISNAANEVLIYGGADADTITISAGDNVSVFGGAGADLIQLGNIGSASIDAGADNDVIEVGTNQNASISGGAGDDVIIRTEDDPSGGNIYIYNEGDGNDIIQYATGDELKLTLSENTTVEGESSANGYLIKLTTAEGTQNTITLTKGSVTKDENGKYSAGSLAGGVELNIQVNGNSNWQTGGNTPEYSPNNIFVVNDGVNTIAVGDATIGTITNNNVDYEIQNVGSDAKLIVNKAANVSINAGAGNDTIYNEGNSALIYGNAGADSITISNSASNVSINAGAGNDVVTLASSRSSSVVLMYDTVDSEENVISNGKDTVYGFSTANDRIYINGDYQYGLDSDNDFVISVGSGANAGTIKLDGIKGDGGDAVVTFVDKEGNELNAVFVPSYITVGAGETTINATAYASIVATAAANSAASETIQNSANDVYISTGAGADTIKITADVENVSVNAGAGNDTIEAVAGHYEGIVYEFGANDGNNWIYNASENDSIKYTGGAFNQTSLTATTERDTVQNEILVLTLGNTKVSMKGYEGGNTLTLIDSNNDQHIITVPRLLKDTNNNDAHVLSNELDDYQIIAYGGNDTITNSGNRASIMGMSGNNIIRNTGAKVIIDGGSGNDSITNEKANNVSISGGAGADVIDITSPSSGLTVNGGAGNDVIKATGNTNGIVYEIGSGFGTDVITGFKTNDTIKIIDGSAVTALTPDSYNKTTEYLTLRIGNSVLSLQGSGITEGKQVTVYDSLGAQVTNGTTILKVASVTAGEAFELSVADSNASFYLAGTTGNDTITNGANANVSIIAGNGNDVITNNGATASIVAGAGNDAITNSGASASIYGDAGADTITNSGASAVIYGGADNDTINNTGANVSILGEAGNDSITSTGDNVTIWGGAGNDILDATGTRRTNGVVYQFNAAGEGYDTISQFVVGTDKLWFSGVSTENALPTAVSINATDNTNQTFTLTAYGNTSIVGTASGDLNGENNTTSTMAVRYGSDFQEGEINIVRILTGNTYSTDTVNSSNQSYNNQVGVALNVVGGQRVENTGVTSIMASGDNSNYFVNKAEVSTAEEQQYVILLANGGNDTIINGVSNETGEKGQYASINAGNGANTIANYAAYVSINAGTGNDTITNEGSNVIINAGNGANTIDNSGSNVSIYVGSGSDSINNGASTSNVYINAGAGSDFITISGGENGGNTVVLGGGNDNVYVTATTEADHGNTYVFAGGAAEGTNSITNFSANDIIQVNMDSKWFSSNTVTSFGDNKENVRLMIKKDKTNITYVDLLGYNTENSGSNGGNKIAVRFTNTTIYYNVPGGLTTPVAENNNDDNQEQNQGRIAEDPVAALNDLFADDNYMTNDAQISDITAITQDNYSAGNIDSLDLTSLTQNNYSPTAAYGKDDEQK